MCQGHLLHYPGPHGQDYPGCSPHDPKTLYLFAMPAETAEGFGRRSGDCDAFLTPENCTSMRVRASFYLTMESPRCDTESSQYLEKDRDGCPEDRH